MKTRKDRLGGKKGQKNKNMQREGKTEDKET
jgi:hypothetical protein